MDENSALAQFREQWRRELSSKAEHARRPLPPSNSSTEFDDEEQLDLPEDVANMKLIEAVSTPTKAVITDSQAAETRGEIKITDLLKEIRLFAGFLFWLLIQPLVNLIIRHLNQGVHIAKLWLWPPTPSTVKELKLASKTAKKEIKRERARLNRAMRNLNWEDKINLDQDEQDDYWDGDDFRKTSDRRQKEGAVKEFFHNTIENSIDHSDFGWFLKSIGPEWRLKTGRGILNLSRRQYYLFHKRIQISGGWYSKP